MLGLALNLPSAALRVCLGGNTAPPTPVPTIAAPTGFYLNGSTNPVWSAAVASVSAGAAARFAAMMVGDSTTMGRGGGPGNAEWTGAAANRPARWVAERLTLAGVAASHESFHGDGGLADSGSGVAFPQYNPKVDTGGWTSNGWNLMPGGSYFTPGGTLTFTTTGANRWRVNALDGSAATWTILIDGAAPTVGGSTMTVSGDNNGFSESVFGVAAIGPHTIGITSAGGGTLNGITAFADTGGVDVVTNAVNGATTATRNATNGNYASRSFIGQVAPAVTIINLGLNDMFQGRPVGTYIAELQAIVAAAKAVSDVLLMFPHPAGGGFNAGVAAFHAAAKQLAADIGVAFFSLFEFEGGVFTAADMQDGVVHPNAATYQRYHTATGVALLKMAGL